jgi:hypothetical protein
MTEAEIAVEAYHERKAQWPSSKFKPSRKARSEHDPKLPGVTFWRYPDGSVVRLEGGDAEAV